jgi:hypothetical protein
MINGVLYTWEQATVSHHITTGSKQLTVHTTHNFKY